MPVVIRDLPPPKDIRDGEAKDAERVERFIESQNMKLSEAKIAKIEKHLKKQIKAAKREYEPLRKRLCDYNDMLEGVVDETNFPFEGASNVTLRYAAGLARTFEAQFNKTVYSDPDLFAPVFDPGEGPQLDGNSLTILQEGFNHSFNTACNGVRELKGGTIPAFRDGTFLLEGSWERRVERANDQRTYRDIQSFRKDYPEEDHKGISDEEYMNLMDEFIINDDPEVMVRFSYNHVMQDGIEYRKVLRSKFLIYPTSSQQICRASLYGFMFELTKEELEQRGVNKEFYESGIKRAKARRGGSGNDSWDKNRLFIEGRSAPLAEALPFRLADVVFKIDLDDDDTLEMYSGKVILEGEECILVSLHPYELRHNIPSIVAFRLVERDHAFDGISMVGDGEDIFNQVDTLFRHDNNVMMLTTSPMFLADQNLKDTLDLGRAENVLRPGVTFWVPNPDKLPIRQLPVQDIAASSGDNNQKLAILGKFVEMLLGVTQGDSGNQMPDDPRAPAHKTQLLLMQASKRIDNDVDTWCLSFPELGKLHATLLYQYSPGQSYSFMAPEKGRQSFPLAILADKRLRWMPRRRSVTLTPEYAISRLQSLMQTYQSLKPLIMQGDLIVIELWNRTVMNSGEPQAEKFFINPQNSQQMAQQAKEMAKQQFLLKAHLDAIAAGEKKLAQASAAELAKIMGDMDRSRISGLDEEKKAEAQEDQQALALAGQGQPTQNGAQPT